MNIPLKAVAYIEDGEIHHLDHLGILAIVLNIPLITTDENLYALGKKFYPSLDIYFVEELLPEPLSKAFDILFVSHFFDEEDFLAYFEGSSKKMRCVYCPHGNSDKGQNYLWMERFAKQDIVLVYGDRMLDFLREKGVNHPRIVISGNYRYNYYQKNPLPFKQFSKKTILYAPTWNPSESSFFQSFQKVIEELPDDFQLIFKVHPAMERDYLGEFIKLEALCGEKDNVLILKDYPPVYPLLKSVDTYLGDFSSIGYDFLMFNKPLFFIVPNNEPSYLHQCGIIMDQNKPIFEQMRDSSHFEEKRKKVCKETFKEGINSEMIWDSIVKYARD